LRWNQLKERFRLFLPLCSGISRAKPYRSANVDQPAPRS
jgi:hypothetical protein